MPRLIRAHDQVAEHYRQLIRMGGLRPGHAFPSVRTIAEDWDISTNTVYRAVKALRDEGWIEASQGKRAVVIGVPGPPSQPDRSPPLGRLSTTDRRSR